jgi:diamine N-acetyltransferase
MDTTGLSFSPINPKEELEEFAAVIRESFSTVAAEFGLTPDNAPTNPAFLAPERLAESLAKGLELFGARLCGRLSGCVGIEKARDTEGRFYIERLAVLPECRHGGLGKALLDFACERIRERGGTEVSIGIMDENRRLKAWYAGYGFVETGKKRFDRLPFTVCFMSLTLEAGEGSPAMVPPRA